MSLLRWLFQPIRMPWPVRIVIIAAGLGYLVRRLSTVPGTALLYTGIGLVLLLGALLISRRTSRPTDSEHQKPNTISEALRGPRWPRIVVILALIGAIGIIVNFFLTL